VWEFVELREIRLFLALAEHRSFRRAAEAVQITPSRASQTLRTLEQKLGVQLVFRTSRSVELSPAGEELERRIRGAYNELLASLQAVAHSEERPAELHVGLFLPTDAGAELYAVTDEFERRCPSVRVHLEDLSAADPIGALLEGHVDLAACRLPLHDARITIGPTLSVEARVLAVARDHPLGTRQEVSVDDIAEWLVAPMNGFRPELIEDLVPTSTFAGRPIRRIDITPATVWELTTLIARGRIVHPTVPAFGDRYGHPNIVYIPIRDLPPSRTALVWRSTTQSSAAETFIEVARQALDRHSADLDVEDHDPVLD
jgi:DNA-binding transcriptional LysR family regulator